MGQQLLFLSERWGIVPIPLKFTFIILPGKKMSRNSAAFKTKGPDILQGCRGFRKENKEKKGEKEKTKGKYMTNHLLIKA